MVATPRIRINYLSQHGVWRVEVDGIYDATIAGRLTVMLDRLARAGRPIVVDLSRTLVGDGSVVTVLNGSRAGLEAAGSTLLVVRSDGRSDPDVLPLPTGLALFPSLEEALESLAPPAARRRLGLVVSRGGTRRL